MTSSSFMRELEAVPFNADKISRIESIYNVSLDDISKKIVSASDETIFFEGSTFLRALAFDEIVDAEDDMNVEFSNYKLVPLFDMGDNDFICFDARRSAWCKFNIVDEMAFDFAYQLSDFISDQ